MAKNIDTIASQLGAKVIAQVPDVGGGAFGAARLARVVEQLRSRLIPGQGRRGGRPTDARWVRHPKVPMSQATEQRLVRLAEEVSTPERKISPMQLAAQILEDALAGTPTNHGIDDRQAAHSRHWPFQRNSADTALRPNCPRMSENCLPNAQKHDKAGQIA